MTAGPVFVDTNVFAYALDEADAAKHARAREVLGHRSADIVVSTQVMIELYAVCTRKLGLSAPDARTAVEALAGFPVTDTDRTLVLQALELAGLAQLSIFDAAIICAAQRSGCRTILTEDLNAGQTFGDAVVENPFE